MAGQVNTLSALAPILFQAARVVPRELYGVLGAISPNFDSQGVAVGDVLKVPVVPALPAVASTQTQAFPQGTARNVGASTLTLNQAFEVPWVLTAEEERSLMNANGIAQNVFQQTVSQAFRSLLNKVEAYICGIVPANASRAFGTAGTAPFASNFNLLADLRKGLDDNGAPQGNRVCVINTTAGANLRKLTQLYQAYSSGGTEVIRQGTLIDLMGFGIRESAGIAAVASGSTANGSYVTNGIQAKGSTSIVVQTGTGTLTAGDLITFAGVADVYTVSANYAGGAGTVTIQEPGLQAAVASGTAISVTKTYAANFAFDASAIQAVIRPALQPQGAAYDQMMVTDPVTGFTVLVMRVPGNGLASYYAKIVFDAFVPNNYALQLLLG